MLDQKRLDFIDWLTGDRPDGQTQADYARDVVGCHPDRLSDWKREFDFRRAWDHRMRERGGDPATLQRQLEALNAIALGGNEAKPSDQIAAVKTYWQLLDKIAPKQVEHHHTTGSVAALSDAALEAIASGPTPEDDERPVLGVVSDG